MEFNEYTDCIRVIDLSSIPMVEVLKEIEKRPLLWLSEENIQCLDSFLSGLKIGRGNRDVDSELLDGFQFFVSLQYNEKNTTRGWCKIIASHTAPSKSLDKFFELLNEYLISKKDKKN